MEEGIRDEMERREQWEEGGMRGIEHTYQEHSRKKGRGQEKSGDRKNRRRNRVCWGEEGKQELLEKEGRIREIIGDRKILELREGRIERGKGVKWKNDGKGERVQGEKMVELG